MFNRHKSCGDVMGDKRNSNRFVEISWSHSVFNPQKSCGAVMGDSKKSDRSFVKGGISNISSVRNTIASIHVCKRE